MYSDTEALYPVIQSTVGTAVKAEIVRSFDLAFMDVVEIDRGVDNFVYSDLAHFIFKF